MKASIGMAIFLTFLSPSLWAEEVAPAATVQQGGGEKYAGSPWSLALYGASAIEGPLQNVVNFRIPTFTSSILLSLSLSYRLGAWGQSEGRQPRMQVEGDVVLARTLESGGGLSVQSQSGAAFFATALGSVFG